MSTKLRRPAYQLNNVSRNRCSRLLLQYVEPSVMKEERALKLFQQAATPWLTCRGKYLDNLCILSRVRKHSKGPFGYVDISRCVTVTREIKLKSNAVTKQVYGATTTHRLSQST